MDHALSQLISRRYGLGGISDVQLVRPGTVAQVWQLSSTQGEFLVRTLTGPGQGERAWTIFCHLTSHGFTQTPYIMPTADGAPAAELDGVWYADFEAGIHTHAVLAVAQGCRRIR